VTPMQVTGDICFHNCYYTLKRKPSQTGLWYVALPQQLICVPDFVKAFFFSR
jgi:hypothetical protein